MVDDGERQIRRTELLLPRETVARLARLRRENDLSSDSAVISRALAFYAALKASWNKAKD